jgi:hypothetical protein
MGGNHKNRQRQPPRPNRNWPANPSSPPPFSAAAGIFPTIRNWKL